MEKKKQIGKGIIPWIAAGLLSLVGVLLYQTSQRTFLPVTILLAAAVVVTALGIVAASKVKEEPVNFIPVIGAVLSALAFVYGFFVMIDPITWVATALNPLSTLYTFIASEIIMALALIFYIAAAFMGVTAEKSDE